MMERSFSPLLAVALAGAVACQDSGNPTQTSDTATLANALASLPIGFSNVQSTFADSTNSEWTPGEGDRGGEGGHEGHHGGGSGGGNGMMCGGLGGLGGLGLGFGFGRNLFGGQLPGTCAYDAASGRVSCQPETRNGLTVTRSAAYTDASGDVQDGFDSVSTNSVNVQVEVTGSRTRQDGNTTTVQHNSDRTVTGLAEGSTQRTVNGTSAGTETTTGSDSVGTFNAVRIIGDTIQNVIVPASTNDSTSYPTAGSIVRSMQVSATYEGQTPTNTSRREVVTFDGSSTAAVEITENGATRSCSLALPHGQLVCS
jgi:hypothetical protein